MLDDILEELSQKIAIQEKGLLKDYVSFFSHSEPFSKVKRSLAQRRKEIASICAQVAFLKKALQKSPE